MINIVLFYKWTKVEYNELCTHVTVIKRFTYLLIYDHCGKVFRVK